MFQLDHDADSPPVSADQLKAAILGTLRNEMTLDPRRSAVKLEAGEAGDPLAGGSLVVDLTGAKISSDVPPKPPRPAGEPQPGPGFGELRVSADPLHIDEAAATLRVQATDVSCVYDYDADDGRWVMMLQDCRHGTAEVSVRQSDLRQLLHAKMSQGAAPHGVTFDRLDLVLAPHGPRGVALTAAVQGRKKVPILGYKSFEVGLRGELEIGDDLTARLTNLALDGRGVVMTMLAPLLEPKLQEIEQKRFPLSALPLGQAKLSDVRVDVADDLRVTATLGG